MAAPKLVFIVEDDDSIRSDLAELLQMEGYEVKSFRNGLEVMNEFKATPTLPNLMLLDLMMPVMSGYQVIDELSKDQRLKEINVLIVSADRMADTQLSTPQVKGFFRKPVDLEPLLRTIQEFAG